MDKSITSKLIVGGIVLTLFVYIVLDIYGDQSASIGVRALLTPLFFLLYIVNVKRKNKLFCSFLLLFSISELLSFAEFFIMPDLVYKTYYVFGNVLYILAYCYLCIYIYKMLNFKEVIKNFKVHFIILIALDLYIIYMLSFLSLLRDSCLPPVPSPSHSQV